MTENTQDVYAFLEGIAAQALAARDAGDAATLNRLASNPSMQKYVNNVVLVPTMTVESFRHWYRGDFATLEIMAEQYFEAQRHRARVGTLEDKLDEMQQVLKALLESANKKQRDAVEAALKEDDSDTENEDGQDQAADEADAETETPAEQTDSGEDAETAAPDEDDAG